MKTRCLTIEERTRIVGIHQGGAKGVEIVAALNHPKSTVNTILKEFDCCGSVEHPKLTKRSQKLSKKNVRIIILELVQDRRQILVDIINRITLVLVLLALHDVCFYNRIIQKDPFLFNTHNIRRLQFAREHRKWTIEDWKKVI